MRMRRMLAMLLALSMILAMVPAGVFAAEVETETLSSTLIRSSAADPWLFMDGGYYYLAVTGTARIAMFKSETLAGLKDQKINDSIVYDSSLDPTVTELFGEGATLSGTWSPEVYYFSEEQYPGYAGWYMFLALRKNTGDSSTIQMVVLKSTDNTPNGTYGHPVTGELNRSQPILDKDGNVYSEWGCGMGCVTISEGEYKGLYTMWIEEVGRGEGLGNFYQKIMINKMSNPWTMARTPGVVTTPTQEWEYAGSSSTHPRVVEGATAVYGAHGEIFLTYSGSGYWSNYGLGQLTWTGGDPLLTSSWHKLDTAQNPIFSAVTAENLRGAGHASFLRDAQGNGFLCYHAYPYTDGTKASARNAYIEPYYIDYSQWNGVSYGVIHVGINDNGVPANSSTSISFVSKAEGLGVPTVSAAAERYVTLTLDGANAQGYAVYRSTDGATFSYLGDSQTGTYTDTDVADGKTYYYRAYSYRNEELSTVSETVSVTVPGYNTATIRPAFTSVTQTASSITLNWDTVDGVDGYKIWRRAAGETTYTALKAIYDPEATSYTDSGLDSGVPYAYIMRSFYKDADGKFHFSTATPGKLVYTKPAAPTGAVDYSPSGGALVTITETVDCTHYVYARSDDNGTSYHTVYEGPETSYLDQDVELGKTYYYRVYAYAGDISNRSGSTLAGSITVENPPATTIQSIMVDSKSDVTFTWSAVEGATGYKIFRREEGASAWDTLMVETTELTYTDTTAVAGKTYVYGVQTRQKVGSTTYFSKLADATTTITVDAKCAHTWKKGVCTTCGAICDHASRDANGVCTACGVACVHNWENGNCYNCGTACAHTWADGICTTCGKSCSHVWSGEGVCTVCGLSCEHPHWASGTCDTCWVICTHDWNDDGFCNICGMDIEEHENGDKVSVDKYVSVDADGNYTLTLESYGKGDVTILSHVKPADIVLVLDVSASMYTPAGASGHVVTYSDDTGTTTVDYTGAGTPASGKTMIPSDMDITGFILPNDRMDTASGKHLGYYIAQSQTTQDWWLLRYFENEDFSPNYKNFTGWGGYRLNRIQGTNAVVTANTLSSENSDNKYAFGASIPERITVWKTQYGALYDSVENFLGDLRASGVDHRISIATFCGAQNDYTCVYNGTMTETFWDLYGGSGAEGSTTYAYTTEQVATNNKAFLLGSMKTVTDDADFRDLTASLNAIITNGAYTCPAAGMAMANSVLHTVYDGNETTRDRIVLLFTDGAPNLDLERNHTGATARDDTVRQAYITKQTYGSTVFSLYTSTVNAGANRSFLRLTSSMYPHAEYYAKQNSEGTWVIAPEAWGKKVTDKEYCFQAADEDSLKLAFQNISSSITSPATSLHEDAVLRDVISDYFDLRDASGDGAIKNSDILAYTAVYLGNGVYAPPVMFTMGQISLGYSTATEDDADGDGRLDTVNVTGFSYMDNYVHEAATGQAAGGKKLIVKIPIQVRDGFWGGNNVPTNESEPSGLYSSDSLGLTKVVSLPMPCLNIQAVPAITARDLTVYYGGTAAWADLLTGITLDGRAVTVVSDGSCTPAESWMDDYANIIWSGYENTVSGKTADSYPFGVTWVPVTDGEALLIPVLGMDECKSDDSLTQELAAAGESADSAVSNVHILTPYLTYQDSTIRLGSTAGDYDTVNLVGDSLVWKNELGQSVGTADVVLGEAPVLTLGYDPAAAAFGADTAVNVTVTGNGQDFTPVTTFLWSCDQMLHQDHQNIETHLGSVDSPEFWVHVSETAAVADKVVIDYGLGVKIDVLGNDIKPQEGFTLVGIGLEDPGVANGTENKLTATELNGAFGSVKVDGGMLVYTPTTMEITGCDVFYYSARYADRYFYGKVTVIPAANLYFEDDFAGVDYSVWEKTDSQWVENSDKSWSLVGTAGSGFQQEDRPGSGSNYGYDDAYAGCATDSMGAAHWIAVDPATYGLATFTFSGTGFDIISRTTVDTGFITVKIYKAGETTAVKTLAVDTYYSQENGVYQIPVIKAADLPYGTYTVEIKCAYNQWLDHVDSNAQSGSYRFYLDAIRVYDPAGVIDQAAEDPTVSGAYDADGENYPIYEELRDLLINADSFGKLTVESDGGTTQVDGLVFIDSELEVNIENYANEGPNNEVYLAPGQSIAFTLKGDFINEADAAVAPVDVQVGLKAVSGSAAFSFYNPGTTLSTVETDTTITSIATADKRNAHSGTLNTAAEMYYSIGTLYGDTVVITNTGTEGILSVTNLKFTFSEKARRLSSEVVSISEAEAVYAMRTIDGYSRATVVMKAATAPTIRPQAAGLAFKDEVYYNVYFQVSNPDAVEIAEMGLITWETALDGTVDDAEHILPGAVFEENGLWKVRSQAIAAKNMGEELYFKIYLKLADGSYIYSDLLNYSAKTYCSKKLEENDEGLKALCVALMNYGAAAQAYFGYKTDDLMNAGLTQEQKALAGSYSDAMIPTLVDAGDQAAGLAGNGGFANLYPTVNFGGAFAINYFFKPSYVPDHGMKLYVFTSAEQVMTLDNAAQAIDMTEENGIYVGQVGGISAKNAGDTVYVCGVYECGGVTYRTGVLAYSVAAYCQSFASGTSGFRPLAEAAAVYTYYANAYLG